MLPVEYPQELIDHVVDSLTEDLYSLSKLSTVSRRFLARCRHHVFFDLTIHVCRDPSIHRDGRRRCGTSHCLLGFSAVLRSRYCFIPRTIGRLVLSRRGVQNIVHNSYLWTSLSHTGGMDDVEVTLPVLKHFREINRLELVGIYWFDFSWSSSRVVTRFFSGVKHLVLDETGFYSGPQTLLSIIGSASRLDIVFFMNLSVRLPLLALLCSPAFLVWWGQRKIKRVMHRHYSIPCGLRHLALHRVAPPVLQWVLKEQLSQLSSVELLAAGDDEGLSLQPILDGLPPTISKLAIKWPIYALKAVPLVPSLSLHRGLSILNFRLQVGGTLTWAACAAWLSSVLDTITSERLEILILKIVITLDELLRTYFSNVAHHDPVFGQQTSGKNRLVKSLEMVDACFVVTRSASDVHDIDGYAKRCEGRVPFLFPVCRQKGLLKLRVEAPFS
ncbi:hypothetical protein GGX14DRAFT_611729 [Mycena pura]|uniref:Uncharacterized protein n=1 Tax=Mycena pura TaxID=153505 RepID=A0AAD6YS88_9AGAR|nr:hypothetical protein GGX14DRAFT_611729 [Mycena pura]